jgi:tetratricopeptide (TPR) repeat protein
MHQVTMPRFRRVIAILAVLAAAWVMALPLGAQANNPAQQQADQAYESGMRLLREKRYHEALDEFKRVEQATPQLPQGYSGEGIALALLGQPQEATQALQKAVNLDPTFWVARRELGIIYWQLNERDQAARELYKIAEQIPSDTVVNALLGQYEFGLHHYAQAAALFAKAPDRVDADPDLALMEAQALLETGQAGPAGDKLESLRQRVGLTPQQTFQLAWLLGRAKEYKDAIDTFNSLPPDFPDKFGRGYGLALAYYQNRQYGDSLEALRQLKALGFTKPELFSLEGLVEEDSGHTLQAYDAFRQGIYRFPNDDRNYLNAATLSVEHYNYDAAAEILSSGIKFIAGDYKLYLGRGVVYSMSRELEKAEADYRQAVSLAPQESMTYAALGICYLDENEFEKAAAILREGVSRHPNDELLYYFLADSLMRAGTPPNSPAYSEALSTVETCLRVDPNYAFAYLQRGRLELLANQTGAAVTDLEHARSLRPDSQPILYQLAIAYRRTGRTAEAAKLFAGIKQAAEKQDAEWQHLNLRNILIKVSSSSQ